MGDVHRGRCPRPISIVAPRLLRHRRGLLVEPQILNLILPLSGIHPLPFNRGRLQTRWMLRVMPHGEQAVRPVA